MPPMHRLGLPLGLLFLAMLSCTGDQPDTSNETGETGETGHPDTDTGPQFCDGEEPSVTLGTGSSEYVAAEDGDEHTMIYGPQGGWHFLGAVKLDNLAPIVELTFRGTWDATGEEICYGYYRVLSVCEAECDCSYWDMFCYIDVSDLESNPDGLDPHELLAYEAVTLSVTVVDEDDREAYDEWSIIAVPDEANLGGGDTGDTGTPEPDTGGTGG